MKTPRPAVPFSVVGGFLGAGKTTLLNRLLSAPDAPRCAVLVNDFGAIAVDASLIESHGGETITLKNGCVCCAMGNDLGLAISQALDLPAPPAHIVVEASGVAHPGRVADVARISPELKPGGVFVLADAVAVRAQLADRWIADTLDRQFQSAECIVISKLDELPPKNQIAVIEMLSQRYPLRPPVTAVEVDWAFLLNAADGAQPIQMSRATHARFIARTIRSDSPVDLQKLAHWIEHSRGIYRMKGWVVDEAGVTRLIQAVGPRISITDCAASIENSLLAVVIGNEDLPSSDAILRKIRKNEN